MPKYHEPGKLHDCAEHGSNSDSELFVVEGNSAERGLSRVRDVRWHAVLPIQGKPMNATKAGELELEKNVQFAALMKAMGTQIGDQFDLSKIRYQRIILLFDPDADGIHGRTLLLLFFHKWMKPLLDAGRIFDARVPRWQINYQQSDSSATGAPKERRTIFASTDEQFQQLKRDLESQGISDIQQTRFRGIGSVGQDTLAHFCTNPDTRTLSVLRSEDAEDAIRFFEELRNIMHPGM